MSIRDTVGSIGNLEVSGELRVTDYADDSAASGNRTVNRQRGRNAFAAGAATVVVTNNLVTASSLILASLEFQDATLTTILDIIPSAGSFTIRGNANATAATRFGWLVIN